MRILITGTSGLLGSHLTCYLIEKGYEVVGIRRPETDLSTFRRIAGTYRMTEEQWGPHLEWKTADILNITQLDEAMKDVDAVVHAAGVVSFLRKDRQRMLSVNQEGTANVVNACLHAGIGRLCHVSSTSVFPESAQMVNEAMEFDPDGKYSFYGLTKHLAELEVFRGQEEGLEVVIVNPCVILGFGDWNSGSSRLFKQAARSFPFYSDGANAFVGVQDVCAVIEKLVSSPARGRYLCISENLPFREIQNQMADAFQTNKPRVRVSRKMAGFIWRIASILRLFSIQTLISRESVRAANRVQRYDATKAVTELSIQFTPVSEVIKKTVKEYLLMKNGHGDEF